MDSGLGNLVAFREINLTLRQHDYFLRLSNHFVDGQRLSDAGYTR
jgi:hypothetical protein